MTFFEGFWPKPKGKIEKGFAKTQVKEKKVKNQSQNKNRKMTQVPQQDLVKNQTQNKNKSDTSPTA